MSAKFQEAVAGLLGALARQEGASLSETLDVCRVDGAHCTDASLLARLGEAARLVADEGYGALDVFGTISDRFDPAAVTFEDVRGEELQVVLRKARSEGWCYFVTAKGFAASLNDELVAEPLAVWVSERFAAFAALTLSVSPWGGPRTPPEITTAPERPRKLVRDQTHGRAPSTIGAWLLTTRPLAPSAAFTAWCAAAVERLAFALPYEIRSVDGREKVVLKGPRSTAVDLIPNPSGWHEGILDPLTVAATWVYAAPREAEARFLFLNNHLSLDWRDGLQWPDGLSQVLKGSLASAREAYAFHLQDQSKDTLKTLGDLRKSLQDEVSRSQTATRDLLSALWRDLAVAGVVLALKSPTGQQVAGAETLRYVAPATAVLLLLSLAVTVLANWRFNWLADRGRVDWRRKLYAFVSQTEWDALVERPIKRGRRVYWISVGVIALLYGAVAWYLFSVTDGAVFDSLKAAVGSGWEAIRQAVASWRRPVS